MASDGVQVEIDMAGEKFIIAEKGARKILVEVKSLDKRSFVYDFHTAVGQYAGYRSIIRSENIDRDLFLAISESAYNFMLSKPFYPRRLAEDSISLIVVDTDEEIIVKWIK
jgi:hypothetical protein